MFGRKRTAPEQPQYPQPPGKLATFHGFSGSPDKRVLDTGLYEFFTDQNVLIHIHDSQCSAITFEPDRARLEMTFIFDDPRYTPKGLVPEARINLLFDQVVILRWDGDSAAPEPEVPGGPVRDLFFEQPHFFRIDLPSTALEFTAQRVELVVT
ncbi:hypothetical protein BA895_20675 [Humibacillus sp. DSM 29435]|uniref:hypothetical protein n=1 Tax=Humibacillus sp. DSM 29435 TaxID=1869167 RepID=UPI0008725F2D|nr:hypothetical protein [Humibacillus sp. DSM 29435]OFE16033.1 hypothetical protein BA895_20675 [Humibacillus sp. DSM 29435]